MPCKTRGWGGGLGEREGACRRPSPSISRLTCCSSGGAGKGKEMLRKMAPKKEQHFVGECLLPFDVNFG